MTSLETLCAAIRIGATMSEACREAGIPRHRAMKWLARGEASGPDTETRKNWKAIHDAQTAYRKAAMAIVHKAAAKGAPRAVDEVLRRVGAQEAEANHEEPPTDQLAFLNWRLAQVREWMAAESGIARTKLLDAERQALADIEAEKLARTTKKTDPRNKTAEQIRAEEETHARELAEIHLQIFVAEYLRRHAEQGVYLATDAGPLVLFG